MAKKEDNKHARPFNFGNGPLVKQTEQTTESGFEAVEKREQGGGEAQVASPIVADTQGTVPVVTSADATSQRGQSPNVALFNEPTQNINIPIPLSLHTRLGIIKAQRRQNIKDMVVQAIDLWLDVQEGKKAVKSPEL